MVSVKRSICYGAALVGAMLAASGCGKNASGDAVGTGDEEPVLTSASPSSDFTAADIGKTVTVEGTASNRKVGSCVELGAKSWWVHQENRYWAEGVRGRRVRVTGVVRERSDLPVFIPKEHASEQAGIPLPPGSDLEAAGKRLVIADPQWTVLE